MKKLIILIVVFLFTFRGFAQEKINWLTTSEFEKALQEGDRNSFIFIENNKLTKKEREKINRYTSLCLGKKDVIKYINTNFICYKFNPSIDVLEFQGKKYKRIEKEGQFLFHEFTNYLTTSDKNSSPIIVLRDGEFRLFTFQELPIANNDLQELIDSGKRKMPLNISVFPLIQYDSKKWLKILTYFGNDFYKITDLDSFIDRK